MNDRWIDLNHEVPKKYEKYVSMLCSAGDADNEVKLLARYQKIIRAIIDQKNQEAQVLVEALEFYAIEFSHYNNAAEALDVYTKQVGDVE